MQSAELQVSGLSEDIVLMVLDEIGMDNYDTLEDWNVETWMGTVWAEVKFYHHHRSRKVLADIINLLESMGARVGSTTY